MNKIARAVKALIKTGASSTDIYAELLEQGVTPCVAQEWANEPKRREAKAARLQRRKERKEASKFGARGEPHRRIIRTEIKGGRERLFHATKGWRSYRVSA